MSAYIILPTGGVVVFDVVTAEEQTLSSTITEHPVETGANITDHVRISLDEVQLSVFVSQTPILTPEEKLRAAGGLDGPFALDMPDGILRQLALKVARYTPPFSPSPGGLTRAAGNLLSGIRSAILGADQEGVITSLQWDDEFDAVAAMYATLRDIRDTATLCQVATSAHLYESMLLREFTVSRSAEEGTGASFELSFKQIRTVNTRLVQAPKPFQPAAKPKSNKGPQVSKPVQKQSLAYAGREGVKSAYSALLGGE